MTFCYLYFLTVPNTAVILRIEKGVADKRSAPIAIYSKSNRLAGELWAVTSFLPVETGQ
uniref:Uncharacterized protein n=1 Tax=Myoviridae sp. ctxi06 TaxID=2826713 RepID=A0A8S5R322_9CAUD|nr:MAG TPA: hypothetical protein [Myoviridae sp. ctxi06]